MSSNSSVVVDFIHAWMERDVDKIMSFVTSDCVYHNIPMEPAVGTDAIRAVVGSFVGMASEVDWQIHHIAESAAGVVLTERTDGFLIGENWVKVLVMGVFELQDGKITAWRDYFDMAQFQTQLAGG